MTGFVSGSSELLGQDPSRLWYAGLITLVALERGFEVWLSRRNAARALARGAIEVGASHFPFMVALHTGFLLACVTEVFVLHRPLVPALAVVALIAVAGSMSLRYWAIVSLGDRWNTRVLCEPGAPRVVVGPYRFLRHPNYLAVTLELVALPLVHTAWLTAAVFSVLNAWMLWVRIGVEERALQRYCSPDGSSVANGTSAKSAGASGALHGA